MASYEEKDYEPIFLQSIRANIVVPFDCYILLKENDRIIHFIKRGQVFPEDKLDKLRNFKFNALYIHASDKAEYRAYLDSFLETEEGKAALKQALEKDMGTKVLGIPEGVDVQKIVAGASASPEDGGEMKWDDHSVQDTTSIQAFDEAKEEESRSLRADKTEDESIVVSNVTEHQRDKKQEVKEKNELLDQVVATLKSNVEEMGDEVHVAGQLTEEEVSLIKGVTDKIQEELERVKGKFALVDEGETTIGDVTQKIRDELLRVKGLAEKSHGPLQRVLNTAVEECEVELEDLAKNRVKPERLRGRVMRLKRLADPKASADELASQGVSEMIKKVQKVLGSKIKIQVQEEGAEDPEMHGEDGVLSLKKGEAGAVAEHEWDQVLKMARMFREFISTSLFDHPELQQQLTGPFGLLVKRIEKVRVIASAAIVDAKKEGKSEAQNEAQSKFSEQEVFALKSLIERQKEIIKALQAKNAFTAKSLQEVSERWEEFSNSAKKNFSPDQEIYANTFNIHLDTLRNAYADSDQQAGILFKVSENLVKEVISAAPSLQRVSGSEQKPSDSSRSEDLPEGDSESTDGQSGDLMVPERTEAEHNPDEVRTENDVLRVQLQNAKSLLEKSEQKIAELKRMHEENDRYIQSLESEGVENKEQVKKAQDQLAKVERENIKHGEHSTDLERILGQKEADVEAKDSNLNELRLRISQLEKELRIFTEVFNAEGIDPSTLKDLDLNKLPVSPELAMVVKEKDKALGRLNEQIERKTEETKELRKEVAKLRGHVQGASLLKKQINSKVERVTAERETMMKNQESMQRKVTMLQNLADAERKSVTKLTGILEELRKDRVEYMGKTAAAMKDYKEMMGKAASLNSHVQAEAQRNKTLVDQNQSLLAKQKELASSNVQLQKQVKNAEVELKRVQKMYKDATGSESSSGKSVFDKRIADLRSENQKLQTQYVTEQRKVMALEKEIKSLQFKIKNQKPAA